MFVRAPALALCLVAYAGWLGCFSSFAEEAPAPAAPGGGTTTGKASGSAAKEPPAKEKPVPAQRAEKPKPSASKEPATREPHPNKSIHKDIDTRLPGLPTHRSGPSVSHTPGLLPPKPFGSPPALRLMPPAAVTPPVTGAARLPHTGSPSNDAARNAFGAVTPQRPSAGGLPRMPGSVVAPAPNRGVINGTAITPRAAAPATIGGPAKKAGVINGTTMRPRL
jgi:hypothetical protein